MLGITGSRLLCREYFDSVVLIMKAVNILEKMVWDCMDDILKRKPEACTCDKCRTDIAAYALNQLKPRYVVTDKGETLARTESLTNDFKVTLTIALAEAIEIVSSNPRHDKE